MASKSFVPPERQDLTREKLTEAALLGPGHNPDSGQQLSSFKELKQGLKNRTLFTVSDSPLKIE
jgi:hypothetical protein